MMALAGMAISEFGRIFLRITAKKPGCGTLSRSTAPIPRKPLRGLLRDFRFNPLRGPYLWTSPKSPDKGKEAGKRMNHEGAPSRLSKAPPEALEGSVIFFCFRPPCAPLSAFLHLMLRKEE
jgi:hypothetical protein